MIYSIKVALITLRLRQLGQIFLISFGIENVPHFIDISEVLGLRIEAVSLALAFKSPRILPIHTQVIGRLENGSLDCCCDLTLYEHFETI